MKTIKVTTNGRVTIPTQFRKKYGLTPRRLVRFDVTEDEIKIIPLATPKEIKANAGILGMNGKLLRALMQEKLKSRRLWKDRKGVV